MGRRVCVYDCTRHTSATNVNKKSLNIQLINDISGQGEIEKKDSPIFQIVLKTIFHMGIRNEKGWDIPFEKWGSGSWPLKMLHLFLADPDSSIFLWNRAI